MTLLTSPTRPISVRRARGALAKDDRHEYCAATRHRGIPLRAGRWRALYLWSGGKIGPVRQAAWLRFLRQISFDVIRATIGCVLRRGLGVVLGLVRV